MGIITLIPKSRELHGGPMDGDHRVANTLEIYFESSLPQHVNVYRLDFESDMYEWLGIWRWKVGTPRLRLEIGERT